MTCCPPDRDLVWTKHYSSLLFQSFLRLVYRGMFSWDRWNTDARQSLHCWERRWLTTFWLGGTINQFAIQMSISEQWPALCQSEQSRHIHLDKTILFTVSGSTPTHNLLYFIRKSNSMPEYDRDFFLCMCCLQCEVCFLF